MTQAKETPAKVQSKRSEAPSSLSEVASRLDAIEQKLDQVLSALTAAANETAAVHQERVDLVRRVASLERWRAEVEDQLTHQQGA
jgi:outer membrane murein-binding lipoprotein Lpp